MYLGAKRRYINTLPFLSFPLQGQMVGWIKMKLGVQVGLSPGHIVLDRDPASPPPKGQSPKFSTNGWMDQDATC